MNDKKNPFWKHFSNAFAWLAGVSFFGLSPLLFLEIINVMSEEDVAAKEINHLLKGRVILFAACAITGSVVFDFIVAEFKVKGWLPVFAIYVSPFCMLAYLFLKYSLVYVQFGHEHDLGPGILSTRLTVAFSILYCLIAKTIYYLKEENARHQFNL